MTLLQDPIGEQCPVCKRENVWLCNFKGQWMCGSCAKKRFDAEQARR
jgi:ribosomal protein L37AE/L43A